MLFKGCAVKYGLSNFRITWGGSKLGLVAGIFNIQLRRLLWRLPTLPVFLFIDKENSCSGSKGHPNPDPQYIFFLHLNFFGLTKVRNYCTIILLININS
jgi:hypothetical protein